MAWLGVITDAELIARRYTGPGAQALRWLRAGIYGIVWNCIILGWVLRAMVKIASPYFHWDTWLPSITSALSSVWPENTPLGTPADGLTILLLLGLVAVYSSLGGLRGVVLTDLLQLGLALVGSTMLAYRAWNAMGGRDGLTTGLTELYGTAHGYLDLAPTAKDGLLLLGLFLVVQSYANVPSDGGGYLMQRINATKDVAHAQGAALLFVLLQYCLRVWPWFIVALAALVLIPIGGEATALGGAAVDVAKDRELAYPVLMGVLLSPGMLGIMVASLLAAFMSTVDTHMNWGASYIVNDVYLRLYPNAQPHQEVRVARLAVLGFAVLAVIVCAQIDTIEQAWRWVAAVGAALGVPTALRWLWWRVNAVAELLAISLGLLTAGVLMATGVLSYEERLVAISAASLVGTLAGVLWGPPTDPVLIATFEQEVMPPGFWPKRTPLVALASLARVATRWALVVGGIICLLFATHRMLLLAETMSGMALATLGVAAVALGVKPMGPLADRSKEAAQHLVPKTLPQDF